MNEVIKNMEERRSVRGYKPDMIRKEDLDTIIEAGTYAATGMGMQSPIIVAVTDKATRDQLSAMNAKIMGTDTDPFYGAPVVLIVLADKARPTYLYDGSLVMGNLMNAAHSLGIGSCWIHRAKEEFESEEGKALLKKWGIEGDYEGIGHCVLGYAAAELPAAKPRKENYVYYVEGIGVWTYGLRGRDLPGPMERSSFMLPVMVGCYIISVNSVIYSGILKYRELPMEQIEAELKRVRELHGKPKKIFLGMVMHLV